MSEDTVNPANDSRPALKDITPMTSTQLRLEVPKRAGWHRHWFRGTGERISRAQKAGYTFVDSSTVSVNNFDLGGDAKTSGNTDMGTSRVSIVSGDDVDDSGQPGRLYLMECPMAYYEAAQKSLADRNEDIAAALRGGRIGEEEEVGNDATRRYLKKGVPIPDLFNPNKRRRT